MFRSAFVPFVWLINDARSKMVENKSNNNRIMNWSDLDLLPIESNTGITRRLKRLYMSILFRHALLWDMQEIYMMINKKYVDAFFLSVEYQYDDLVMMYWYITTTTKNTGPELLRGDVSVFSRNKNRRRVSRSSI